MELRRHWKNAQTQPSKKLSQGLGRLIQGLYLHKEVK